MKRAVQAVLLLVVAGAGYMAWMWMHPSPEKAIRKQMDGLQQTLVAKPGEGNFARVAAINRTISYFTQDVVISGEGVAEINESISGKTELQQALFAARQRLDGAITFYEVHVIVAPTETNATVNFTAAARLSGQKEPFSHDFKAQFVDVDGKWLISRVEPIALKRLKDESPAEK